MKKSRQTISNHLKTTSDFETEKERRKEKSKERKREQNKKWALENPEKKKKANLNWIKNNPEKHNDYRKKDNISNTEMDILRLNHHMAVKELDYSSRRVKPIYTELEYYRSAYKTSGKRLKRKKYTDCGLVVPECLPKYI